MTGIFQDRNGSQTQEQAEHTPQLKSNQYAALAGNEYDEENDTESTGAENDRKTKEYATMTKSQEWTEIMRARGKIRIGKYGIN